MSNLESTIQSLRSLVDSSSIDTNEGAKLLSAVKKHLLLSGVYSTQPNTQPNPTLVNQAREALELSCLYCIKTEQIDAFQRTYTMLRPYYHDTQLKGFNSTSNNRRFELIYLYLLSCLCSSPPALADFYSEIELLPIEDRRCDLIKAAQNLELLLESGTLTTLKDSLPLPELSRVFIKKLGTSSCENAANAIECAYKQLPIAKVAALLGLTNNQEELHQLIKAKEWQLIDNIIVFEKPAEELSMAIVNHETISVLVSVANSYEHAL